MYHEHQQSYETLLFPSSQYELNISVCVLFSLIDLLLLFFFFSSRRRHTRLQGDWSSDVCSSDLKKRPHGRGSVVRAAWRRRKRDLSRCGELGSPTSHLCHSLINPSVAPFVLHSHSFVHSRPHYREERANWEKVAEIFSMPQILLRNGPKTAIFFPHAKLARLDKDDPRWRFTRH